MTDVIELLKDKEVEAQFKQLPVAKQMAIAWRMKWLTQAHDLQILSTAEAIRF